MADDKTQQANEDAGTMEGVVRFFVDHPYLVPGGLAPGLVMRIAQHAAPERAEDIAQAATGFAGGVAKSLADPLVGATGLLLRAAEGPASSLAKAEGTPYTPGLAAQLHEAGPARVEAGMEQFANQHPVSAGLGQVSGTVGSIAGGVGGPGWIAKGGEKAVDAAVELAGVRAAESGAGKLLQRVAKSAGVGGTQSALFWLGDLDKEIEKDPHLTVDTALAGLGLDVMFGTAVGGGGELVARGLGGLLTKAGAKIAGSMVGGEMGAGWGVKVDESVARGYKPKKLEPKWVSEIYKTRAEAEAAAERIAADSPEGHDVFVAPVTAYKRASGARVLGARKGEAAQVGQILLDKDLIRRTPEATLEAVEVRQAQLADEINKSVEGIVPGIPEGGDRIAYARNVLSKSKTSVGESFAKLVAEHDQLADIAHVADMAVRGNSRGILALNFIRQHPIASLFGAGELALAISHGDILTGLAFLAAPAVAAQGQGLAAKIMYRGGRALFLSEAAEAFRKSAAAAAQRFFSQGVNEYAVPALEERMERANNILQSATPEKITARADAIIGPGVAGPATRLAFASRAGQTAAYLQQRAPKPMLQDPFSRGEDFATDSEKEEFLDAVEGADGPSFLDAIKRGGISENHVTSMGATNPRALAVVREELAKQLAQHDQDLTPDQEEQLRIIFGSNVDGDLIRALQDTYGSIAELKKQQDIQQAAAQRPPARSLSRKPFWTSTDQLEADKALK